MVYMIRTQIYLPEDLKQDLEFLARKEKRPVADIVRRALKNELGRKRETAGDTLLKIASMAVKGPGDLSTNFFDYLYGEKSDYATKKGQQRKRRK